MESVHKIAIIGAGAIGTALAHVWRKDGKLVAVTDKNKQKKITKLPLAEVLCGADCIVLCVPTAEVRSVCEEIAPLLVNGSVVLAVSKGMEQKNQQFVYEVMAKALPRYVQSGLLAGPMLAGELQSLHGAGAMVALRQLPLAERMSRALGSKMLRLEATDDVHGVALCSVLKNVYAVGMGIAKHYGWGHNRRGMLFSRMMQEMAELCVWVGGKSETALGLAGIGDAFATGTSPDSRNVQAGIALAKSGEQALNAEGVRAAISLEKLLGAKLKHYPLLALVVASIKAPRLMKAAWSKV